MKKFAKQRKSGKTRRMRLQLTPEIQALYFQCLAGKTLHLSPADQTLIVQVFNRQFPALPRAAQQAQQQHWNWNSIAWWGFSLAALGIALFLIVGCSKSANAREPIATLESQLNQRPCSGQQCPVYDRVAEVSPDLIRAAQDQAEVSMRKAWQQGSEDETQPVNKLVGSDGTVVLAQNAPRRIITLPNGEPGLNDRHTTIAVIQAVPTPVPTPRPRPTPLPTPVPKQETKVQTTVNGLDNIETRAVLPEALNVEQLDAVKKITDNGALIAQQRFGLEQYKITQETELEYLRIVKNFALWGFLASIPFLFSSYWILKHLLSGYQALQKDRREYKLKEIAASERMIYADAPKNREA